MSRGRIYAEACFVTVVFAGAAALLTWLGWICWQILVALDRWAK